MTFTRRDRRDWRIFLWISLASAVVSAWFGYAVAEADTKTSTAMLRGLTSSIAIATPIVLFELATRRPGGLRRLRRLPLAAYFVLKVLFYLVVIVSGLLLTRIVFEPKVEFDAVFRSSIVFAVAMSVFGNIVIEMGGLLGFSTLRNLLIGRYVQPRREQRTFLLIDMKDSTGLAEKLGVLRFHALLNTFLGDIAYAALECDAEIHKYVGDEAILSWPDGRGLTHGDCLVCPFVARDLIASRSERYRARFGIVPEFRAALHHGEIVAGEVGDVRREIAYVGDTLNVASRLLEAAKELGRDVLVSNDLLQRAALPARVRLEPLPKLGLRGRTEPLEISALSSPR